MQDENRPDISVPRDISPIQAFISEWQQAIDTGNADLFNKRFALNVLWGSPYAAIASGYQQIHAIHQRMFSSVQPVKGAAKFELEHVRFVTENVAVVYVRRITRVHPSTSAETVKPGGFDELALLVLVEQSGQWWLAAAQHVPDRRDVYKTNK